MPICLNDIRLVYSPNTPFQVVALDGINVTIKEGEFVGLIGHTGSGKSSLIQLMNGLIQPSQGTVTVDGVDLGAKGSNLRAVRQKVGLVFQYPEHQLFEETVSREIAFGLRQLKLPEEEQAKRVREALQLVNLDPDTVGERSPFELSGGQMRRVALASVLVMQPQYLILDEPTAGLDPRGRDEVLGQIQLLHKRRKMAVILVSHSMEDVARVASRLIVMHRGTVAMQGEPKELFQQAERLRSIGLGIPQVTELMQALAASGVRVSPNAITVDEAQRELAKWLRGKAK